MFVFQSLVYTVQGTKERGALQLNQSRQRCAFLLSVLACQSIGQTHSSWLPTAEEEAVKTSHHHQTDERKDIRVQRSPPIGPSPGDEEFRLFSILYIRLVIALQYKLLILYLRYTYEVFYLKMEIREFRENKVTMSLSSPWNEHSTLRKQGPLRPIISMWCFTAARTLIHI